MTQKQTAVFTFVDILRRYVDAVESSRDELSDPERLSEEDAFELFVKLRWAVYGGHPNCPRCGCEKSYRIRRRQFRCSKSTCRQTFSATTGTDFSGRKLSFKKIIVAMMAEIRRGEAMPALRLSRKLDVQYKTAWILQRKLQGTFNERKRPEQGQAAIT